MDHLPLLTTDLIRELNKTFPPITSKDVLNSSEKVIAHKAGQRSIIELLQLREQQDKDGH